jgi:outer membrane protein insertion porin family
VEEGPVLQIGEIRVSGNKETKEEIIVRESGLRLGTRYNEEEVLRARSRLNRMNIFSQVAPPELFMREDGSAGILLHVVEGNTNTFDGAVGIVPGSGGQSGYLSGLIDVAMRNLFGTARKFSVHWSREDQYSQEIALAYTEPWVLRYPVDANLHFDQRQQDTTYVRRQMDMKADVRLSGSLVIGGTVGSEVVIPSALRGASIVSSSQTLSLGIEARYDSRDDIVSPTEGALYHVDYQAGTKKIYSSPSPGDHNHSVQRAGLDGEYYFAPVSRQVIAVRVHGRRLTADEVELSDLYRFGGATTLRGYRENQFSGSSVAWTNLEYRFLTGQRSFFFGFLDVGYYYAAAAPYLTGGTGNKIGYGVGVRMETGLGNIGVSFALGEGDSFGQGKIHVSLLNQF